MALVLSLAAGCAPADDDGQPIHFKLGHVYETRSPTHRLGSQWIGQRLQEANCKLSVAVFPASQLGNESELVEQLVAGELELIIAGPSFLAMWHPPLGIFDAAYAFRDMAHMMEFARSDTLAKHWELLRQKYGVRLLDTWAYGTRHITSNRPIRSYADMAGFRLRFPSAKIWQASGRAMGASPMPIPFADVYLALQTGTADGQENPISVIRAMGFHEVQRYLCLTEHIHSATVVMVNDRAWMKLHPTEQEALSTVIRQLGNDVYQQTMAEDNQILQQWERDETVQVVHDVDIQSIRQRCIETFSTGYPFSDMYRQLTSNPTTGQSSEPTKP